MKLASNHAVIKKEELLQWLDVTAQELRILIDEQGLPPPRFGQFRKQPNTKRITSTSRWRVGDVRAWLAGSEKALKRELSTEIGADRADWKK
jgi:hypothetical protein